MMLIGLLCALPAFAQDGVSSRPLNERSKATGGTMFTLLTPERTGINFVNPIDEDHPMAHLYASAMSCGGVAVGDYDRDGLPDVYVSRGPGGNKLYRNRGGMRFDDVTDRAGVAGGDAWGRGAAFIDIDSDGDLDLFLTNYDAPNQLYINQGDGTFNDDAKRRGLDFTDASHTPAFCDYDRDGDLDVYILTNRYYHASFDAKKDPPFFADPKRGLIAIKPKFERYYTITSVTPEPGGGSVFVQWAAYGRPDKLYRNNGDGTFTDVTKACGIGDDRGRGLSATWFDYNDDGWPDLYVANDFEDLDRLYRNNGDGTFTDVAESATPYGAWFAMGADFADVNGDGLFDFVVADMSGTNHYKQKTSMGAMGAQNDILETGRQYMRNMLFINGGAGRFMEAANMAKLDSTDWTWAIKLEDLDNDGMVDAYFTNGMAANFNDSDNPIALDIQSGESEWDRHKRAGTPMLKERNLAFRNYGDLKFKDVSKAWGLDQLTMSYGAVNADLDRDGDLDLVVVNLNEPLAVYRNDSADGHRALISFVGRQSNRDGWGVTVRVETADGVQRRELTNMRGYMGGHEAVAHFGLGKQGTMKRVIVDWPSGHRQVFDNLKADRHYTITEPAGTAKPLARQVKTQTMFESTPLGPRPIVHKETPYDDFRVQPLLPNKLSQLGPGLAVGDVDGDGDDDFYLAGSRNEPGKLLINYGPGNVRWYPIPAFEADKGFEDMGALFFDADGDNDLDLYVVSGGVESFPDQPTLNDRLYLNNGQGLFKRDKSALPDLRDSGGVVTAADFDRDGDLDLFVGGRVIPRQYPLAPNSRLLVNTGGRFTDMTPTRAESLAKAGLVTGAVWSDVDRDGWIDLMVTYEWGPIRFFKNDKGQLVDRTEWAGLDKHTGWWNGIAARDIDNDGDIDFVATNFGLNTKYHADLDHPTLLYYGDFEGTGKFSLVEGKFEGATLFPVRGRSCSSNRMPFIADKFPTYKAFALAPLQDIYTPSKLKDAHRFAATMLESVVLINDGRGSFTVKPLPRVAQVSPGFGVVLTELDGDGHVDLCIAQNFFTPQIETPRMAGGLSMLLRGKGDGTFTPVWPNASGISVPDDAKCLAVADVDSDGRPDLVFANNNGPIKAFANRAADARRFFTVRLKGKSGNPTGVGARVTVTLDNGTKQTAEMQAGAGYLSQSSAALTFGVPKNAQVKSVDVRWPDGKPMSVVFRDGVPRETTIKQ